MLDSTLLTLALVLARLSILSFGGGTAILGQIEREFTGRGWITEAQFSEAYVLGQVSPGPGTLWVIPLGYYAAGVAGAIVAFFAFFGPPALVTILVTGVWARVRESAWPRATRTAMLPIVVGLTASSVWTMGRISVRDLPSAAIFGGASLLLMRSKLPTPVVLAIAAAAGTLLLRP